MTTNAVQEKILYTAYRLFYQNGYRATGINQIIKEADVAKATFYGYFPSKEQLALAYLDLRDKIFFRSMVKEIDRLATRPVDKIIAICQAYENIYFGIVELEEGRIPEELQTGYHGCHYIKIYMESPSKVIMDRAKEHQKRVAEGILFLLNEAVQAQELQKKSDIQQLSIHIGMLIYGAVLQTQWDSDYSYFQEATIAIKNLLKPWSLIEI